jgi:hypothetical protein
MENRHGMCKAPRKLIDEIVSAVENGKYDSAEKPPF